MRRYTLFDRFITEADKALRTVSPRAMQGTRPSPSHAHPDAALSDAERRHVGSEHDARAQQKLHAAARCQEWRRRR